MSFIPIPNGIQLCFLFDTNNLTAWQFCLTFRKTSGTVSGTDLTNVANEGSSWWTSNLKARIGSTTSLNELVSTNMTTQGAPQVRLSINESGTLAGTPAPTAVPVCVSHRSSLRGRSYRGRSYISGLTMNVIQDADFVTSAYAANLLADFGTLRGNMFTAGYAQVIPSKQHNGLVTNPAVTTDVTGVVIDSSLDVQRRRAHGRGA